LIFDLLAPKNGRTGISGLGALSCRDIYLDIN